MNEHKSPSEQYANWCRHFTGILYPTCKADVKYRDVRTDDRPYRWPCFKDMGCSERCASASFLSEEEAETKIAESSKAITAFLSELDAGICPHCHQKIEEEKQVGRSVYALPCYHRLYQGTAKKKEKPIHPYFLDNTDHTAS